MKLHHVDVFTNHPGRILDFYQKKLGLKKEYKALLPKSIIKRIFGINIDCYMAKLSLGEFCIEVFWPLRGKFKNRTKDSAGYNHFCLKVKDKEVFCARLEGKYKTKVIKINRGDNYYIYFIKDPDGNVIEVKG